MQPEPQMPKAARSSAPAAQALAPAPEECEEPERMLSTGEVSGLLDVNAETVRRYRERWGLPHVRLPSGRCRYPERALKRWVARNFVAFGDFE